MKKPIVFIIIIIIIIIAGYFIYDKMQDSNNGEESMSQDQPEYMGDYDSQALLGNLAIETQLSFSQIMDAPEMRWTMLVGDNSVEELYFPGKTFAISGITDEQKDKIRPYFQKLGFDIDVYNTADGVVGGVVGYKKGNNVCAVFGKFTNIDENGIPAPNAHDVSVTCGVLSAELLAPGA